MTAELESPGSILSVCGSFRCYLGWLVLQVLVLEVVVVVLVLEPQLVRADVPPQNPVSSACLPSAS